MKVIGILAHDLELGIGKNNNLPWHCKNDLMFFKEQTLNSTIIMGHNTFKSLPKLLPQRNHIVISKDSNLQEQNPKIIVFKSLEEALANLHDKVFLIGGASLFNYAIKENLINELLITEIPLIANCDTFLNNYTDSFKEKNLIKTEESNIKINNEELIVKLSFFRYT